MNHNNKTLAHTHHQHPHQTEPQTTEKQIEQRKGTKESMRSSGGEIVQVEGGGHIVKSTGRKDRHSKVYTSKGPRDRRVRLSAHTAIEFYDVQDRLGYDRPSKAVDWLIRKAKPSIDKLAELPPWHPNPENTKPHEEEDQNAGTSGLAIGEQSESSGYNNNFHSGSPFISPHVETDHPISLFPTTSSTSSLNFQNYPHENLGLSLHSFQDHPGFIHWQSQEASANQIPSTLFSGSNDGFDENHYNRIVSWNNEGNNRMGFMVNSQPFLGQGSSIQSSFSPSVRSWNENPMASLENQRSQQVNQASIFGSRFGLAGFNIPHRIEVQGEEENHGGSSNRPSSASTSSHQ